MYDKAVNTYPSIIRFAPESFMTQRMCDKAVERSFFVSDSIFDQYKTSKMYDRVAPEWSFFDSILLW